MSSNDERLIWEPDQAVPDKVRDHAVYETLKRQMGRAREQGYGPLDFASMAQELHVLMGAEIWDFNDEADTVGYRRSRYLHFTGIPMDMRVDIQRAILLKLKRPDLTSRHATAPQIASVHNMFAVFLHSLREYLESEEGLFLETLEQLDDQDLARILACTASSIRKKARTALALLGNDAVKAYCLYPAAWRESDVNAIDISHQVKPVEIIPVREFCLLDRLAMSQVMAFLKMLGKVPHDKAHDYVPEMDAWVKNFGTRETARCRYEEYAEYAGLCIRYGSQSKEAANYHYQHWQGQRLNEVREGHSKIMKSLVTRTAVAAQSIIAQYTPGRYSDWLEFDCNSLRQFRDYFLLRGKTIKTGIMGASYSEVWPAPPHVRDAFECLKELTRLANNDGRLWCAYDQFEASGPMSSTAWNLMINFWFSQWIQEDDGGDSANLARDVHGNFIKHKTEGWIWPKYRLKAQAFRTSLIYYYRQAGLGVAECTDALKHTFSFHNKLDMDELISQTTGVYGQTLSNMVEDTLRIAELAELDVLREQINPETYYAGENAEQKMNAVKQLFKATIDEWKAAGLENAGNESVLQCLVEAGYEYTDVGLGDCLGTDLSSGYLPPCKVSKTCSPFHCKNAIQTRKHAPNIMRDIYLLFKQMAERGILWGEDMKNNVRDNLESLIQLDCLTPKFIEKVRGVDPDNVLDGLLDDVKARRQPKGVIDGQTL